MQQYCKCLRPIKKIIVGKSCWVSDKYNVCWLKHLLVLLLWKTSCMQLVLLFLEHNFDMFVLEYRGKEMFFSPFSFVLEVLVWRWKDLWKQLMCLIRPREKHQSCKRCPHIICSIYVRRRFDDAGSPVLRRNLRYCWYMSFAGSDLWRIVIRRFTIQRSQISKLSSCETLSAWSLALWL
jgi:hypothetical protein